MSSSAKKTYLHVACRNAVFRLCAEDPAFKRTVTLILPYALFNVRRGVGTI